MSMRKLFLAPIFALSVLSITTLAYADPTLTCRTEMYQFASGGFGMSGDSNQRVAITLKSVGAPYDDIFVGETTLRFENDQSGGAGELSLHGARIVAEYSEGNGLEIKMAVLKFASADEKAASTPVAILGTHTGPDTVSELTEKLNVTYVNPVMEYSMLSTAEVKSPASLGLVKDGDLLAVELAGCKFNP